MGATGDTVDVVAWLRATAESIDGRADAEVPCGTCTGCCTSSQFVPVGADELDSIAHIPRSLLFAAPGGRAGELVMGYDQDGRCPMLGEGGCTIYQHRPQACRSFDCRVFVAAAIPVDEPAKVAIRAATERWVFVGGNGEGRLRLAALRAAGAFLQRRAAELPEALRPANATQAAVAAVLLHEAFIAAGAVREPSIEAVTASLEAVVARLRRRP